MSRDDRSRADFHSIFRCRVEAVRSLLGVRDAAPGAALTGLAKRLATAAGELKAAGATLGPGLVGSRYESFGVLTGALGQLIRWGDGIREADPHADRFRAAARQLAKDVLRKESGGEQALAAAAAKIRDLDEPEDVRVAAEALLAVSLPLPLFIEHMPVEVAGFNSGESEPSLIVAFLAFTLDGHPLATPATVEPNILHDLEVELRLTAWPDGATELVLDVLTVEDESVYRMPRFNFTRPGGAGPYHLRAKDRLRLNVPQTLRSRPLEFAYRAQFLPQQPETRVVVEGQRHLVLRSFDPEQHAITGYRVVDRRLVEILGELRHQVGIPDREMDDFILVLSVLGGVAGQSLQDNLFPGIRSESDFQSEIRSRLRMHPRIGSQLEEHPRAAGGITDLSFRGIRIELKVECNQVVAEEVARRFIGQTAQYVTGSDRRLGILCILDCTPKQAAPGSAGNDIFLIEVPPPQGRGLPLLVGTIIIRGNLTLPSQLSRGRGTAL